MAAEWGGPFIIKGVSSVHDARKAVDIGAHAIMVSNHGGRQLDHAPSPIGLLEDVMMAVGDKVEVIVDGGVRRGTDVLKALALGAKACSVGRAYLFGLGAGGEKGVDKTFALFRAELKRDMALLGCSSVDEITEEYVRARS